MIIMKLKWLRQVLIPIVLIVLLASVFWTYSSIKSGSSDREEEEAELVIVPDYTIVSGKNLIAWPAGTVFEQGMASYFYAAEPRIAVTPVINLYNMRQGALEGTIKSQVILQAVDDKAQVYWQYPLRETGEESFTLTQEGVGPEQQLSCRTAVITLDVTSAYNRSTLISNELMFQSGIFQLVVNSDISLKGTLNGEPVDKRITQTLPLTLQQAGFSLPKAGDIASRISFTKETAARSIWQTAAEAVQNNPLQIVMDILLTLLLLFLLMLSSRNTTKEAAEHRRFREWITEGSVEISNRLQINILSLEGLVDLAIDLDKRVIYDSRRNKYYVLTEDIVYVYDMEKLQGVLNNRQQLGRLLLEKGLLKPEQLEIGLYYQQKIGSRLGESLTALGFIDETTLYSTLAAQQGLDYYEPDQAMGDINTGWLSKMSIQKARALMALPLGTRADGRPVIACSEAGREGIQNVLKELFGPELFIVAARPSVIYELLEKTEEQEKQKTDRTGPDADGRTEAPGRLAKEEAKRFIASYSRGKIEQELLLKAAGLLSQAAMATLPEKENIISWSVHKNLLEGTAANLINGLERAVGEMDFKSRQEKQIPSLTALLLKANYLTEETAGWVERELSLQGISAEKLLADNYLASAETMKNAVFLLRVVKKILTNTDEAFEEIS